MHLAWVIPMLAQLLTQVVLAHERACGRALDELDVPVDPTNSIWSVSCPTRQRALHKLITHPMFPSAIILRPSMLKIMANSDFLPEALTTVLMCFKSSAILSRHNLGRIWLQGGTVLYPTLPLRSRPLKLPVLSRGLASEEFRRLMCLWTGV